VVVVVYTPVAARWPWLAEGDHSLVSFFITLHMNFLLAPLCYLLIFSLASGTSSLSRILSSKVSVFLGDISYSTYLGHPLAVVFILVSAVGHIRHVTTAAELVATYIMSWMFYAALEVPAKGALRRLFAWRPAMRSARGPAGRLPS